MNDMAGADDPRGWAPIEPDGPPSGPPPPPPGPTGWAPPTGPAGWAPPTLPRPPVGNWGAPPTPYGFPLPKGGDARTGPLPLHPMSVGDVLDGAFKLLK